MITICAVTLRRVLFHVESEARPNPIAKYPRSAYALFASSTGFPIGKQLLLFCPLLDNRGGRIRPSSIVLQERNGAGIRPLNRRLLLVFPLQPVSEKGVPHDGATHTFEVNGPQSGDLCTFISPAFLQSHEKKRSTIFIENVREISDKYENIF